METGNSAAGDCDEHEAPDRCTCRMHAAKVCPDLRNGKNNGHHVGAITLNQEDIDYAIENNIIDEGIVEVKKEFVSQFDIVIFALYPSVFIKWIEQYNSYFKKGAIISDVSGVKTEVVYKVQELLENQSVEFIGAHPMAGKEVYGVKNASETLFEGANFIITPTPVNSQKAIDVITKIAQELGFKTISILMISNLFHVIISKDFEMFG